MAVLEWDKVEDRLYEAGLDRGVLYLPDGTAVPWNGLISVEETPEIEATPIYFDGMKIGDDITLGSFSGSMTAFTYPDEFSQVEGLGQLTNGVYVCDQPPKRFGLAYRTQIGNVLDSEIGYKLHVLYNALAIPSSKSYETISDSLSPTEFQWSITAIPEEVIGFRPTAHFVINSLEVDSWLLEELEAILYGNDSTEASLIPLPDLISFITHWYRIQIIDNGDGTWTAISRLDDTVEMLETDIFQLNGVNAVYLDADTYLIGDTK